MRQISAMNLYHVMARGNWKQKIFNDDTEYAYYIKLAQEAKADTGIEIHAYCLMPNHIHFLLKGDPGQISDFMYRVSGRYAHFYNVKNEKVGHLFQGRYKSKPINNKYYYLNALRYVHQNPQEADICPMEKYKWSSYGDYDFETEGLTDTEFALTEFGSRANLLRLLREIAEDPDEIFDEPINKEQVVNEEIWKYLQEKYDIKDIETDFRFLRSDEEKRVIIKDLKGMGLKNYAVCRILRMDNRTMKKVIQIPSANSADS